MANEAPKEKAPEKIKVIARDEFFIIQHTGKVVRKEPESVVNDGWVRANIEAGNLEEVK